jgi:hypothetical protein
MNLMDTERVRKVNCLNGEGARYLKRRKFYGIEAFQRTTILFFAVEEVV